MTFFYDYPDGWNVETTHEIAEDTHCHDAIEPTIAFAVDFGSTAHQHSFWDGSGTEHVIVVRQAAP
jgi:hypothetical protein